MFRQYYLYIVTNRYRTTLYIGVTNNLSRRLQEHYTNSLHKTTTFAGKYNCYHLVYYEVYDFPMQAITREKELKKWRREKKNKLISSLNPNWEFLNNYVFN